ncbi:MAG TPA: triose-phosphate isomerase, partial [Polyangiaceae bacterium]|nr:triose-phosphate isomerase [Polyangiaceae bacterium]
GNWKLFHGGASACPLAAAVAKGLGPASDVEVVVAPPFTALAAVASELDGTPVAVGAQDVYERDEGAHTGQVSGPMLVEAGATWVIVGHSELRAGHGLSEAQVAAKLEAAHRAGLRAIACVGETLEQRQAGSTLEVIGAQIDTLVPLLAADAGRSAIAYEPVWAIGTGHNATPAQAEEVHAFIRQRIAQRDPALAEATRLLYGGSVKAENAAELFRCPNVDGALVGGASLDAGGFLRIVGAARAPQGS